MSENEYKKLRNGFIPKKLKIVFLLESPPQNGMYFYDEKGSKGELLFRLMMKLIEFNPQNKLEGLKEFQKRGYFLVDSIYSPVDKITNQKERNKMIISNVSNVINDLENIIKNQRVKIIPIKKNVCQIFSGLLESVGFKILNNNISFPVWHSQQKEFFEKINILIKI